MQQWCACNRLLHHNHACSWGSYLILVHAAESPEVRNMGRRRLRSGTSKAKADVGSPAIYEGPELRRSKRKSCPRILNSSDDDDDHDDAQDGQPAAKRQLSLPIVDKVLTLFYAALCIRFVLYISPSVVLPIVRRSSVSDSIVLCIASC